MADPESPENFLISKAIRIANAGIRLRAVPRSRAELLDVAAVMRSRIKHGPDPILKALGMSCAGARHFLETEFGLAFDEADLLAGAMLEIVQRYNT